METKQAEERQVESQKQWREERVENVRAEHRHAQKGEKSGGIRGVRGRQRSRTEAAGRWDKRTFVPRKEGGGEGETGRNCYCKKRTTNTSAGLPAENSVPHPLSLQSGNGSRENSSRGSGVQGCRA